MYRADLYILHRQQRFDENFTYCDNKLCFALIVIISPQVVTSGYKLQIMFSGLLHVDLKIWGKRMNYPKYNKGKKICDIYC